VTYLPDDDITKAALELVGRTGATNLEIGYDERQDRPSTWYAHAHYGDRRIAVDGHPDPGAAVQALATRLLHGGRCIGCTKLVAMSDGPVPIPARMLDDSSVDPEEEKTRGLCRWSRVGPHWVAGCGERAPAGSSREKLAQALAEADAPSSMIAAAREGRWDDYLSPHPFPQVLLIEDLRANGLEHLIDRVKDGDFDATKADSDAWAKSEAPQGPSGALKTP
jgi:hypothetical protein